MLTSGCHSLTKDFFKIVFQYLEYSWMIFKYPYLSRNFITKRIVMNSIMNNYGYIFNSNCVINSAKIYPIWSNFYITASDKLLKDNLQISCM